MKVYRDGEYLSLYIYYVPTLEYFQAGPNGERFSGFSTISEDPYNPGQKRLNIFVNDNLGGLWHELLEQAIFPSQNGWLGWGGIESEAYHTLAAFAEAAVTEAMILKFVDKEIIIPQRFVNEIQAMSDTQLEEFIQGYLPQIMQIQRKFGDGNGVLSSEGDYAQLMAAALNRYEKYMQSHPEDRTPDMYLGWDCIYFA